MFSKWLATFPIIILVMLTHGGDPTCVVTDTSCPCGKSASSGLCMKYQGQGNCLLGACSDGYKCDCLGYEMCSIKKCERYTTGDGVIPGSDTPFSCHLTPDAGTCVTMTGFLNHTSAADSAKLDSSHMVRMINSEVSAAETDALSIQEVKIKVDAIYERLDSSLLFRNITTEEREDVNSYATSIVQSIVNAEKEIAGMKDLMVIVFEYDRQVFEFKRLAYIRRDEKLEVKEELKTEIEKAESEEACQKCGTLKEQFEELETQRAEAVINAANLAYKTKESHSQGLEFRQKVADIRTFVDSNFTQIENRVAQIYARIRMLEVEQARQ